MATWTDSPATSATHIRAVHINELRRTVDADRAAAGLAPYTWSDGPGVSTETHIRAVHFTEIRAAIEQYMTLPNWSVGTAPSSSRQVSARDMNDLRNWTDQFSTAVGKPTGPDPWSCGQANPIKGVDVSSNNQSQIQTTAYWTTVQSMGYSGFAFIKATEGTTYVNPYLSGAWSAANQVLGSGNVYLYHFLDWQYSGKAQADNFYTNIKGLTNPGFSIGFTFLALDVEEPNGSSSTGTPSMTVVNDFMNELALNLYGDASVRTNLVMYTNQDTWVTLLGNPSTYSDTLLWLAPLAGQTYCPPYTFGGWVDWTWMQYSDSVVIGGAATDVNELV